jgi:Uma2 family endonuclease
MGMNLALAEEQLPVRLRFESPITDDQLLHFCAVNDVWQIEREANGEIVVMTPAGYGSSKRNVRVSRLLDEWAELDGRGETTGPDGGYVLPDGSMRSPDAAWTSFHRLETAGGRNQEGFAPICPDFVIELRSQSDRLAQVEAKMEMWIANGAEVAWLIDPKRRVVEIYRPGDSPEVLHEPSSAQGSGPVVGFELVMARVWL